MGVGKISEMVGTSGRWRDRSLLLMPSGLTFFELRCGMSSTGLADTIWTLPANMSVNAGPMPRYGTWTISKPALLRNSSEATWVVLPAPAEATA